MTTDITKLIVEELLKISSDPEASILKRFARDIFRGEFDSLCGCDALVHIKNLTDIAITDGDFEFTAEIVRRDGKYMYFSPSDGWIGVLEEDIALYKINFEWLIRQVMNALDIPNRCEAKEVLEDKIWVLGRHRIERQNIPIIITRNTIDSVVFESLKNYLNNHHKSRDPALVLAMDRHLPAHLSLPGQNVLVRFEEAMVIESPEFRINTRMLAGKMGGSVNQDGFGSGYRNLIWNGNRYRFTKKEAEAIEYMHNASGPRHQDEILAEINSSQKKLLQIFRSKGKTNPAWGEVIKGDRKGSYWLDL